MRLLPNSVCKVFAGGLMLALLGGCQSAYYGAMEKVGYAKRDILVDRVEAAAETQQEVQEEVQVAYEAFNALLNLESSDLEARYEALNDAYEDSRDKADELSERVAAIESVADALFDEWQEELGQYSSQSLRASSAAKLKDTKRRYAQYLKSLKRSEARVEPVLAVFKDHVLFLKHNLNAEKVSALKGEVRRFDGDVQRLISEMDKSIADAKAFVKELE
ncbi:DUF2959 family protein [Motiliproteus sediminis]|uniref:DUF2959 family protein n=1 Tax=Motiliproteus sediminis TaxID=1468178 RepID=UPI001AEF3801|nr:DUF2959 family protein [Motiliproteus sediminis]